VRLLPPAGCAVAGMAGALLRCPLPLAAWTCCVIDYASLYRLVWMSLFIFMLFFICELAAISSFAKRATPLLAKALLAFP
jgi:hypothetical protein